MIDFENTLSFVFAQLTTAYRNNLEKVMNELDLHSGQIFVLISLWKTDGQSQIDLVKNLNLSPPTVNKMVKSLEANGFVKFQKCETDGRLLRVFLTAKGIQYESLVAEQWNKMEAQCYSNLTETEKLIFAQLLAKLKENFNQTVFPFPS